LMLCEGVAEVFHTMGWRHCFSGTLRAMPLWRLFRIRMAGNAMNYITPSAALGGEVTKVALLATNHRGVEAVSGVLIEKICLALGHLSVVCLGVPFVLWRIELPRPLWLGMLTSTALLASGILTFLLLQKHGKVGVLIRWLAARRVGGRALQKLAKDFTEIDGVLKRYYRNRPLDLWLAVGWHLTGFSAGIAQTWFFLHLMNKEASLALTATVWFLGMWFDLLSFAVPMNLGVLEGSRIVALKAVGFNAVLGMTYGVALRITLLFWAGFGLVNYALLAAQVRTPAAKAPAECPDAN